MLLCCVCCVLFHVTCCLCLLCGVCLCSLLVLCCVSVLFVFCFDCVFGFGSGLDLVCLKLLLCSRNVWVLLDLFCIDVVLV